MTTMETTSSTAPAASPNGSGPAPRELMLFVQSLKGAPASVLLALALSGGEMSHQELRLWTRCGKDQVTLALKALVHLGWASGRTSRGPWTLARALPLPSIGEARGANPLKGLSSSSDSLNPPDKGRLLPSARSKELLQVIRAQGIREPTASELAELPHVTAGYVQAHVQAARSHGLRLGAAIEAMRKGAPAPEQRTQRSRQAEVEEKIRRFMEGT